MNTTAPVDWLVRVIAAFGCLKLSHRYRLGYILRHDEGNKGILDQIDSFS
jgi:hypothetical protein